MRFAPNAIAELVVDLLEPSRLGGAGVLAAGVDEVDDHDVRLVAHRDAFQPAQPGGGLDPWEGCIHEAIVQNTRTYQIRNTFKYGEKLVSVL